MSTTDPPRVLLVEDNQDDALLVERAMLFAGGPPFDLCHVERLDHALIQLAKGGIAAVLLDLSLPDSSGLNTVRRVRSAAPSVPIVVLTASDDESAGLAAVEIGAQDYLVKGSVGSWLLVRALRYAIERQQHEERARLLIQEQAARAAAEVALRAREEFLSLAAHELYTPLTSLHLMVQVMLKTAQLDASAVDETLLKRLGTADRQCLRLGRLIQELLDVSRIQAGRLEVNLASEDVDLRSVVDRVVDGFAEDLRRIGCPVSVRSEGQVAGRWDASRVEQVVTNLLSNAMKYGAGGPIDVALTALDDGATRLEVKDHGIGVAPDMQARIFDRFERAVSSRSYGGLGLGLYIVRSVVEAHGGTVSMTSALGQGSTFQVTLPRLGRALAAASRDRDSQGDRDAALPAKDRAA